MTADRWLPAVVALSLAAPASAQDAGAPLPAPPANAAEPAPSPTQAPQTAPAPPPDGPPQAPAPARPATVPAATVPPPKAVPGGAPPAPSAPTHAVVRLHADYAGAYLELRAPEAESWQRACDAPCDRLLLVDGMDARVGADGMTTSNVFRVEPGVGTARLRVNGGSATTRRIGLAGLIGGIPVSLVGMGLFGYGSLRDEDSLRTAGIVTLAVGAVAVVASLPLLMIGTTSVRDGKGKLVARTPTLGNF